MDKKTQMYKVIISAWELMKHFGFERLSLEQWEKLIDSQSTVLLPGGNELDPSERKFAEDVLIAVVRYYERMENGKNM